MRVLPTKVMATAKQAVAAILQKADVHVNGSRPGDIIIHNDAFYPRVLAGGSLALGESYMDGWWDCKKLDEFFTKLIRAKIDRHVLSMEVLWQSIKARFFNMQHQRIVHKNIEHHYDIGNDLYKEMLDPSMTYSCGYWKEAKTLEEAQQAKYDLICRKIGLKKGMTVLDIGCGWGGFAMFAAKRGAKVTGITLSKEQQKLATARCKGLPVTIKLQDYRAVTEKFDRVVSIGMFEHVGVKNHATYFSAVRSCLKENGLFLLHTIGSRQTRKTNDPWIEKYIFPHSIIPSATQVIAAMDGKFVLEDWHNFGPDYDRTLMAWHNNISKSWKKLKKYDERFQRMWSYYLLSCAGSFRSRHNQLWQLVLSPNGIIGGVPRQS